jgi:hypothetical protein
MPAPQKKAGRPTKYKTTMPEELLEMMHEGYSMFQVCRKWRIDDNTFFKCAENGA